MPFPVAAELPKTVARTQRDHRSGIGLPTLLGQLAASLRSRCAWEDPERPGAVARGGARSPACERPGIGQAVLDEFSPWPPDGPAFLWGLAPGIRTLT